VAKWSETRKIALRSSVSVETLIVMVMSSNPLPFGALVSFT
jgi:hypothetical protein